MDVKDEEEEEEEEDDDVEEDDGGGRPIPRPGSTLCASLRSRNVQGHSTRAILRGNLQEKCRTLMPGQAFCASLRRRNAHGHVTRGILCRNLKGKSRTPRIPPRLNTGP